MPRMPHRRTEEMLCPACGYTLDAYSHVSGDTPAMSPGDFSVCIDCASILLSAVRPDGGLQLVLPTPAEMDRAFTEDPDLRAALDRLQQHVRQLSRGRPAPEGLPH